MENSKIKSIKAREILDSRGNFTVEVDLITDWGIFRDSAPSGASKGKYEAKTVTPALAVKNINKIVAPKLRGKNVLNQRSIDEILKKLEVGANTTTSVSMACCRAAAASQNQSLYQYIAKTYRTQAKLLQDYKGDKGFTLTSFPRLAFNVINGGVHADSNLDFQEFMIVPRAKTIRKSVQIASKVYQHLRKKLGKSVGDEGGFVPSFRVPEKALELLKNQDIIIDVAASQFYKKGKYKMKSGIFTKQGLQRYYSSLIEKYPIIALEDPFSQDDFESWQSFKPKIPLIGDDLLVTNPQRIKMAKQKNLCNGLLLKINQIGTVTQALESAKLARSYDWKIMVSHRSGETNDDFIADLAVGIEADFIKAGAPARGERVAKYNRLLRIEEQL